MCLGVLELHCVGMLGRFSFPQFGEIGLGRGFAAELNGMCGKLIHSTS